MKENNSPQKVRACSTCAAIAYAQTLGICCLGHVVRNQAVLTPLGTFYEAFPCGPCERPKTKKEFLKLSDEKGKI